MQRSKLLKSRPDYSSDLTYLSVSKTKTFKDCQKKYKFTYIQKLPQKDRDYLAFGKLCHETLERFHKFQLAGDKRSPAELLPLCFAQAQTEDLDKNAWKKTITKEQVEQAWKIIEEYIDIIETMPDEKKPTIMASERGFNVIIEDDNNKVILNGFIDLTQTDPDGVLHVADYKTSKDDKFLKKDFFQLLTYAFVLFLEHPELNKVRCSYIMLKMGFKHITKEFTRKEVAKIEQEYLDYCDNIKKEKMFAAHPTPLCDWCDFIDVCSEGKGYSDYMKNKKENGGVYVKELPAIVDVKKFGETDW